MRLYFEYGIIGGISAEIKYYNEILKYIEDPSSIQQTDVDFLKDFNFLSFSFNIFLILKKFNIEL